MVRVPENEIQTRLARGDVSVRDSLFAAWQRATDPDTVATLFGMLSSWGGRDAASRARIEQLRVSAGDTAYLYGLLAERAYRREPVDSADVRAMLPFMEDPSLAWGLDLSRDWLYENLVQGLTTWPRAAAAVNRPGDSVACTVAACRLLAEQWRTAREPRLRDVGLVALMSVDPVRWADTVLALDGPRHPLLHPAALLARGVGATWPAASKAPIPPPDADWHAWLEWMDGRDPRYVALKARSDLPAALKQDTVARVRFEESHRTAMRFYEARSGRDIVAEWRRGYEATRSDSGRLVFGSMLDGVGELPLTEAEVVAGFRSGEGARISLARRALFAGFARATPLRDTVTALRLLERLLSATLDSGALWRSGAADLEMPPRGEATTLHAPRRRIFLNAEGLPARIRAKWGGRAPLLTPGEWQNRDAREAAVFYTISPIQVWGRYVRVELTASERTARTPDQVPAHYASGTTYYLMESDGEWLIVAWEGWVT
jgi:hypothetical protein